MVGLGTPTCGSKIELELVVFILTFLCLGIRGPDFGVALLLGSARREANPLNLLFGFAVVFQVTTSAGQIQIANRLSGFALVFQASPPQGTQPAKTLFGFALVFQVRTRLADRNLTCPAVGVAFRTCLFRGLRHAGPSLTMLKI